MNKLKETELGFYMPSFFRMKISTNNSLDNQLNFVNEKDESTFLHEYIHFIQDVTTTFGFANINRISNYLRYANNYILKYSIQTCPVPIIPDQSLDNITYTNMELFKLYYGNGEESIAQFISHNLSKTFVPGLVRDVNYVVVDYKKTDGSISSFKLGAVSILESMAYLIEEYIYPNSPKSPDIPYNAAIKLAQLIYPPITLNKLNVLALCDVSLLTFHPAEFFYTNLIRMKEEQKVFNDPRDIYDYVFDGMIFNFNGISDISELFQKFSDDAEESLTDYFNDKYFDETKKWLSNLIYEGTQYRHQNPHFIIDLAEGGSITTNKCFRDIFTLFGSPIMTNDRNEYILYQQKDISTDINPTLLWAIEQIFNLFIYGEKSCEMVNVCEKANIKTDKRCYERPWERLKTGDSCQFCLLLHHWGLSNFEPIIN